MAGQAVSVTVHPDGKNPVQSHSLLRLWVENAPERLVFVGTEAGDQFKSEQIPPRGELDCRGGSGSGGSIGRIRKVGNAKNGGLQLVR